MRVQLVSDIHLDALEEDGANIDFGLLITPSAPTLVMAGDISAYNCPLLSAFLSWVAGKFEYVFWVLGNHEFYNTKGLTMNDIKDRLRSLCPRNVYILDNEYIILDDVIILGSTLWSHVPVQYTNKVETTISDYRYIFSNSSQGNIRVEETNQLYKESVHFIRTTLEEHKGKQAIVVTHHAPSMKDTIHPMYHGSPLNHAFASDIVFQDTDKAPDVWCYGHTHYNVRIDKHPNGYKLLTNQFGYEGEHEGLLYKFDCCVDIGTDLYYG